jgi:hypothetical protein
MTRLRIFGMVMLILFIVSSTVSFAGKHTTDNGAKLQKTTTNGDNSTFLINNIFNYYTNKGSASYNFYTSGSGLEWPKGSGNTAIFQEGLVWSGYYGAKVPSNLRTGGSAYRQGLQAGRITNSGLPFASLTAENRDAASVRTYRVRPDINPSKTFAEVQSKLEQEEVVYISRYQSSVSAQTLYNKYIADWNEWPASQGAPFDDKNGNGTYEPGVDIPGVAGADQTLWEVMNDLDGEATTYMYGSNPMGIEYQRTIWGYRRTGALGNIVFIRNKVINKSDTPLDSAYFAQWSDPDLGDAADDFVACDIPRSLGYVYNGRARDTYYGDKPPAAGYDFFQGPIVASLGDSAIFNNKRIYDYKNLGMSSFNFFINSSSTYTDPTQGQFIGTSQWYNLMNGKVAPTGASVIDPLTGQPTKFMFSGDPTTGQGWIEGTAAGSLAPPGDRRLCLVTGPFTLAPGDTQEVVVATIVAQGGDRISSISVLKFYSDLAQSAFDNFFNLPSPPPSPVVSISQQDGEIILDWSNVTQSEALEAFTSLGYTFQGYNVYQASTPSGADAKRLATYDIIDGVGKIFDNDFDEGTGVILFKPVQYGNDVGVVRYYETKEDALKSRSLVNGQSYYYAITAYSYNPLATPKSLESAPLWRVAVPQKPVPGIRYSSVYGDTVANVHGTGVSDGSIVVTVVDPAKTTGHHYIVFVEDISGTKYWSLKDVTLDTVLISRETNQTGDVNYKVVDGLMVKVLGPPPGMKDWTVTGTRYFTYIGGDHYGLEGFYGCMGNAGDFWGGNVDYAHLRNVTLRLTTADTSNGGHWPAGDANSSAAYRYLRGAQNAAAKPEFAPFIINPAASYAFQDYRADAVPFSAWNTETVPPTRLAIAILENNVANGLVDGKWWPPMQGNNWNTTDPREWFFILDAPYGAGVNGTDNPAYHTNLSSDGNLPLMWVSLATRRNYNTWTAGNEFNIIANHINLPADTFSFVAPNVSISTETAKADVEKINVFPNPYFGFNLAETSKYQRFITFSHLPKNATIRIFALSGVLVRTLVKEADATQQFLRWDLNNGSGLPVAAGMYIAYVDMPDLGKTKILKFAIIPESQILDKY